MNKKRRPTVTCTSLECPQVRAYYRGEPGALFEMPRGEALRDNMGRYWCTWCSKQCQLMNWALANKWPEVNCPPYAVAGGDPELWKTAVYMGRMEFIETLYLAVFGEDVQSD